MLDFLREIRKAVLQLLQDVKDLAMLLLTFNKRLAEIRADQLRQNEELRAIREEQAQQRAENEQFQQIAVASLADITEILKHGPPAAGFRFLVEVVGTTQSLTFEQGATMDAKRATQCRLTPTPIDRDGFPATYDLERGITVESSDPSIVSVVPDPDNAGSFLVDTPGAPGADAILGATGDAVPGPDGTLFHGTLTLHLIPTDAIGFAMNLTPL